MSEKMREDLDEIVDYRYYGADKDKLMAWATRWSGRPSREQIANVLNECNMNPYTVGGRFLELVDRLHSCYPPPAPAPKRVTREEISQVLVSNNVMLYSAMPADALSRQPYEARRERLLDDLCRLIGLEEDKPKVWCLHINWDEPSNSWRFSFSRTDDWDICPVAGCHKPRPA